MSQKKYVSLSKLGTFLEKLNVTFASLVHKHTISDITDYVVDNALSPTSTNPVQNAVIDAEFEAMASAMSALEYSLDNHNHDDSYDAIGSAETALATSKEYTDNKVASMVFVGTYEEYQTAYNDGRIPLNAFVILTDDETGDGGSGEGDSTSSTTAMLGYAVLGQMVLG